MPRILQFGIFLTVGLSIIAGIHYYLWWRLVRAPAWPPPYRLTLTLVLVGLGLSAPLTLLLSRLLAPGAARLVLFVPYLWMGVMFLLFFGLLATDLLRLLAWVGLKIAGAEAWLGAHRMPLARVIAGAVLGVVLVATALSIRTAFSAPTVRRVEIRLRNLPPAFDGFTIALLADLHLGPTLARDWLADVVARTNVQQADLIAIVGDLVDQPVDKLLPELEPLRALRARHGVFFTTGNHEFYSGLEQWTEALPKLGLRVLDNERIAIERDGAAIDLGGIHDLSGTSFGARYAPDLPKALAGRDAARPVILLSHQSRTIQQAEELGVCLQLSGHNHNGQLWPWMYFVGLQQPYVVGLHRHGACQIYVSEGTGFWGPPMRLLTTPEIALLVLRPDKP